jgi:uncharacterized iron-regulated membrane protein
VDKGHGETATRFLLQWPMLVTESKLIQDAQRNLLNGRCLGLRRCVALLALCVAGWMWIMHGVVKKKYHRASRAVAGQQGMELA